jgi:hypothetical protein
MILPLPFQKAVWVGLDSLLGLTSSQVTKLDHGLHSSGSFPEPLMQACWAPLVHVSDALRQDAWAGVIKE